MELVNTISKWSRSEHGAERTTLDGIDTVLRLLAPMTPHITANCGSRGTPASLVHLTPWPVADAALLVRETETMVVQVNGKVRARVDVEVDISEDARASWRWPSRDTAAVGTGTQRVIARPSPRQHRPVMARSTSAESSILIEPPRFDRPESRFARRLNARRPAPRTGRAAASWSRFRAPARRERAIFVDNLSSDSSPAPPEQRQRRSLAERVRCGRAVQRRDRAELGALGKQSAVALGLLPRVRARSVSPIACASAPSGDRRRAGARAGAPAGADHRRCSTRSPRVIHVRTRARSSSRATPGLGLRIEDGDVDDALMRKSAAG